MPKLAGLALSLAAVSAAPAVAQSNDFVAYDATRASTVAERLVLCDLADQLSNGAPNRDAQRAFVRVEQTDQFELALPPDFTRPSGWYDYDIERAYHRLRRADLVQSAEVEAARERYRAPLRGRLNPLSVSEKRFFRSQANFCRDLVRSSRSR